MTATKETAKKAEVKEVKKTIKNEVKETTKETTKETAKEVKKTRNESMNVPKEAPTKEATKEVPKETTQVTKEKSFEKRPSAGKQIREMFESVISKLKDEHLEILTSSEKTKETLKIRYPFLKEATENKEDRKVNGNSRYGSKTITINDKSYWITNDLYERNIETFKTWVESLK